MPIEQIQRARGIIITSNERRALKANGWLTKLPVCAFETNHAVLISCAPEFEDEICCLLSGPSASEAITKMQKYFNDEKNLASEYHRNYGLDELNLSIDTDDAIMLDNSHYEQYNSFRREISPLLCRLMEMNYEWLQQHFKEEVNKQTCFCLFRDNKIVSATESETIPNRPDGIIDLGINTLKPYRQNGYASTVCAAFIKYYQQKNILPLWSCAFDNEISEKLALRLGFKYMGNVFYVASF